MVIQNTGMHFQNSWLVVFESKLKEVEILGARKFCP